MTNSVLTILVIAVGAAADVGLVRVVSRLSPLRQKNRIRKAARLLWGLGFFAALLVAVPFAGYYVCALLTASDDKYAAGWLLFFAGFIVLSLFSNRIKYSEDIKRLDEGDGISTSSSGRANQ
jgi:MFS family permease